MQRRKHGRLPFEARIDLQYEELDAFASGYSANLSAGGVFVTLSVHPPLGTHLSFNLKDEDGQSLIRGRGQVAWVRKEDDGPDRQAGMAVRFLELTADSQDRLRQVLGSLAPPSPQPPPQADQEDFDPSMALLFDLGASPDEVAGKQFLTEPWTASGHGLSLPGDDLDEEAVIGSTSRSTEPRAMNKPLLQEPPPDEIRPPAAVRAGLVEPPAEPRRSVWNALLAWLCFLVLVAAAIAAVVVAPRVWGPPWTWFGNNEQPGVEQPGLGQPGLEQPTPVQAAHSPEGPGSTSIDTRQAPPSPLPQATRASRPSTPAVNTVSGNSPAGQATLLEQVTVSHANGTTVLTIVGNGRLSASRIRHFFMPSPPRQVIRVTGIDHEYNRNRMQPQSPYLKSIRFGLHQDVSPPELSVVLDLSSDRVTIDDVSVRGDTATIRLTLAR